MKHFVCILSTFFTLSTALTPFNQPSSGHSGFCETEQDCSGLGEKCISNGYGQLVCKTNGIDCRTVRCAGCPLGQCGPISMDECCQDTSQCSSFGCCDDPCEEDSDCKDGPCRACIFNGYGEQVCGDPMLDCSKTFCFAACPPGECSPKYKGECCDDISKCSKRGCCGSKCRDSSDCLIGSCNRCITNGWGQRICAGEPATDCSTVRCFGACETGECSPRSEGECCDDISKCSSEGCCGSECQSDDDCNPGFCPKCRR